ncbi:MAG: carboxypeptidase-like regulatory domain-containing protein [Bacteroidia bacterium]
MNKLLLNFFIFFTLCLKAQNGQITGVIMDSKTGEPLPGATILIEGTNNVSSADFDGKYHFTKLTTGKKSFIINYISYTTKKIVDVEIKNNDLINLNILLEPSTLNNLNEIEVVVTLNKENNTALVLQQKNASVVSDGVSAETFKRTPDRNTSDVIKRVSGTTIQDNKFAIIRGMNDRYVSAYLNGAPLPSSESDKKAFSFDIFPANLLDNIIIYKTATPDLPADFAGGIIQINTKSIPDKSYYSFNISSGYNFQTTFKEFKTYNGGKTDWLGFDDGTRALNSNLPTTKQFNESTNLDRIEYAKLMKNDWALINKNANPNLNLQYTMANVGKLFKKEAGSVFALTYNNTNNKTFNTRREFEEQKDSILKIKDFNDSIFNNNILTSALWNVAIKLSNNNQINFKNLFSLNTDDKVVVRNGLFDATAPIWEKSNVRWFTQNRIYTSQLQGDHFLPNQKIKIKWVGGYSNISRNIPNLRKMVYQKSGGLENDSFKYAALIDANTVLPNSAGSMFFSKNNEQIKSLGYDLSKNFNIANTKHEIKIGAFHQFREREFQARLIGYTRYRKNSSLQFNSNLLYQSQDSIFNESNIGVMNVAGPYNGGFKLSEATTNIDSYSAKSFLNAAYIMLDSRLTDKLRFIYGVRAESYKQTLNTYNLINESIVSDTTNIDFLPSINSIYALTDKINLRAAFYKTVVRPEFRELASFNFYDFITDFSLSGQPNLSRSLINNYDLRFEYFPGFGQLFSISGFYKDIKNPIEQVSNTASAIRSLLYSNAKSATNIGIELEYRFNIGNVFKLDSNNILNNVSLFTNVAIIKSKVNIGDNIIGNETNFRPLQGQSPFIINSGLQYLNDKNGWGASISYNVIGKRIYIVGSVDEPTYWENSRHVIDFQLLKTFKNNFEIKFNLKDAIAQDFILYQDINKNGKLDKNSIKQNDLKNHDYNSDNVMIRTKLAPTISVALSYKF